MIQTGSPLFEFSLENQYGESITSSDLSRGRVLVVFYPWAFSRVCGSELAELQQNYQYFVDRQVRLAAISVDHKFTLRNYAEHLGIEFDLLADFWPHGEAAQLAQAFDAQRGVATRLTLYIVDGIVREVFSSSMTKPREFDGYVRAVEASLEAE